MSRSGGCTGSCVRTGPGARSAARGCSPCCTRSRCSVSYTHLLADYSAEHADAIPADIVSRLTNLYNTALATPASERSEAKITEYVNQGVAILAEAGITVKVDSITLANGEASITGSVSAADAASVSFAGSISAQNVSGGGSTAPDTSGVIKPTGVSADSVALLGIVLAAVLGTAVVGTRKLRAAE